MGDENGFNKAVCVNDVSCGQDIIAVFIGFIVGVFDEVGFVRGRQNFFMKVVVYIACS